MSQNDNPSKKDNGFSWDSLPHIVSLITVLAYIALGIFVGVQWKYFSGWFLTLKDLEVSKDSVKIERFDRARSEIDNYAKTKPLNDPIFDQYFAQAAVVRAARVAPALKGALILWIDDDFAKSDMNAANKLVSQILDDFGIRVIRARSSNEARERINDNDRYDLILTSSRHNTEPSGPLRFCEVQYFEVPGDAVPQYGTDPESFSRSVNANAPGGFVFIDQLKQQEIEKENSGTEASMLPVIFFSASSGGISGNICARAVTNRGCPAAKRDQRARRKALV